MTKPALLVAFALTAAGCDPIRVADIVLLVRESPQNPRTQLEDVTVSWVFDDETTPDSVTFDADNPPSEVTAIPFGTANREITITVSTGGEPPTAIGRAEPLDLIGTDTARPETPVLLNAPLFVAAPGVPELVVNDNAPEALGDASVCFDAEGNVFLAGGTEFAGGRSSAVYVLNTKLTLRMNESANLAVVNLPDGPLGDVACGAFGGQWFVYFGECVDDNPGGAGRFVRGEGTLAAQEISTGGSGCRPRVVVGAERAWITMSDRIVVYGKDDLAEATQIFSADVVIDRPRYDIALDGDELIIAGGVPGVTIARLVPGSDPPIEVDEVEPTLDVVVLAEFQGKVFALDSGGLLHDLSVPAAQRAPRAPALDGVDPTTIVDALFLADGRLVALTADAAVIEGQVQAPNPRRRQSLARTIGGAVLLLGGEPGFDALVAPEP